MSSERTDRPRSGGRSHLGEAIEFLPPDERAFGPGDDHTFVGVDDGGWPDDGSDDADAAPRSRWASALAGLGVAGILTVGVVAATPWAGDDESATPPSTSVATPTTVAERDVSTVPERTAPLDPDRTGWVLDPLPDGMRGLQFVSTVGRSSEGFDDDTGWGEVWAERDATRTSGRWFSLTLLPFRELDPDNPTWFPVDVGGRRGVAEVGADGVVSLAYDAGTVDAPRLVTLEAFGFTVTELVELADSIGIVDDRPQMVDDRPEFLRPELLAGLGQIAASATDTDLTTRAVLGRGDGSLAFYGDGRPWDLTVVQEQRGAIAVDDQLLALSLNRLLVDPTAWPPPDGVAGAELVVGTRTLGSYELVIARWATDGRTLSVLSTRGLDATLGLLPAVRFAPADEWTPLEEVRTPVPPASRTPPGLTVASGPLPDGRDYAVLHWAATDEIEVRVGTTSAYQPTGEAALRVVTVDGASFVVAVTDEPAASLRVSTDAGVLGVPVTEARRTATDGTVRTSYLGVVALADAETVASFSAELVIPTGEVVASLAPWGRGS